ncbi:hypothetical protein CERZMDRAFT_46638 [Cercospora zeae-maydis SCOH1-5]|uniref:Thioredoxin-like fold domain-containing protein n=1 Tax=Cercospora zeae-maydis SCOH1-5 TaxID=717836 RepID=A0A6A6F6Y5_9PEZI|nr:hypothetical protein CERZMDRAFT_46638 [Cercospora zeae-maydis SCOH1-5]
MSTTDDALTDDGNPQRSSSSVPLTTNANPAVVQSKNLPQRWFALPPPVKRVFDLFPLREYERNCLPGRVPGRKEREGHVLHVFGREEDLRVGRPSFHPGCLRWQTYLRFRDVPFTLVPSNNHASPSGSLPFLQPASSSTTSSTPDPVSANKLQKWLATTTTTTQTSPSSSPEPNDIRLEAYQSLMDNRIRKAWLYQLYLAPENDALMQKLYVSPCSRNPLVRFALTRQLRSAAEEEVVKSAGTNIVDAEVLLKEAAEAFEALSQVLGEKEWFFGAEGPGLFDASVFAYLHLVLDEHLGWGHNPLMEGVRRCGNLVGHRERILERFYYNAGDGDGEWWRSWEEVRKEHGQERPAHNRTTSMLGKRKTLNLRA